MLENQRGNWWRGAEMREASQGNNNKLNNNFRQGMKNMKAKQVNSDSWAFWQETHENISDHESKISLCEWLQASGAVGPAWD